MEHSNAGVDFPLYLISNMSFITNSFLLTESTKMILTTSRIRAARSIDDPMGLTPPPLVEDLQRPKSKKVQRI